MLFDVFSLHVWETDMVCNVKKTVCMIFAPCNNCVIVFSTVQIGFFIFSVCSQVQISG